MDKIAIISDIHGNLEALTAVLNDIKDRGISEIYCLGDIIHKGVHVHECIELIKENCKVVLQGNCDDYFTKEHDIDSIQNETEKIRIEWNKNLLTEEEKSYLQSLPLTYEFYLSGRLIRIFHASPFSQYQTIGEFADLNEIYNQFLPTNETSSQEKADIAIYGHIHTQSLKERYNRVLINCGSIGNSLDYIRNDSKDGNELETTSAQYLIIEGNMNSKNYNDKISYQFIRIPYDINKELYNDIYNPEKEAYSYELTRGKYRDMEKVYKNFEKYGVDIDKI